jgi:hypothetical protein
MESRVIWSFHPSIRKLWKFSSTHITVMWLLSNL